MKIGTKLALALFTAALVLAVARYWSMTKLETVSLCSKGDDLADRAAVAMSKIEEDVWGRVEEMGFCAAAANLPKMLAASNREFDENPDAAQQIAEEDAAWAAGEKTPRLKEVLNDQISHMMVNYARHLESANGCRVFAEMFATNRYGVVVAATGRTSDYLQTDEAWYQAATAGTGGWIGDVQHDESSRTTSFDVVVPIRGAGDQRLGMLKGVLDARYVGRTVADVQARSIYRSATAYLVSDDGRAMLTGQTLHPTEGEPRVQIGGFGRDLSADPAVVAALALGQGYHVFRDGGARKLAVFSRSEGMARRKPLGWTLVMVYDADEVVGDVLAAERVSLLVAIAVLIAAALAGFFFARSITTPVARLTKAAAEIAGGEDHSRVADRGRRDELGDLTRAFNRMADELTVFRKFAEASGHAFGMTDLEGRIVYANPASCRFFGASSAGELLGRSFLDFFPEPVREEVENRALPALMREETWSGELPVLGPDGSLTPALHFAFLIRDERGEPFRIACIVTDITELREAETALRENHAELEAIYERMVDGILVADVETRKFLRTNRTMCEITGYSKEELLTMGVDDIHPPEDLSAVLAKFEAQARGHIALAESTPVLRKDGSVFFADIATREMTYHGRPCLVGLFHDITDRKEAQETLRHEHRTLRRLLETHDHERRLIAYEIHDGLAQQLTAAIMHCQACRQVDRSPECDRSECCGGVRQMLADCLAEARRLIGGVRPPILDESGVVTAIRDLVQAAVREDGPEIEFHARVGFDRLEPVLENSLYRIAQESLANACRHAKSDRVRVDLTERDGHVQIAVQDWGVGFDPQAVEENRYGLTGIRERARLLGGNVSLDTAPGDGTRLTVLLPMRPGEG